MAIRRPDGDIHTESHPVEERWVRARESFLRGLAAVGEAFSIGTRALSISMRISSNVDVTPRQLRSTLAAVAAGAIVIFVLAPGIFWTSEQGVYADVLEAASRAAVLLVYMLIVSRSPSARQIFEYHGAEHKVIAAFEHNVAATIEDARAASPIHPRCGTSFVTTFVIVAGMVHSFAPRDPIWASALWRVVLVPVDAAIAYELLRATARTRGVIGRVFSLPGRALQHITTREPTEDKLVIAKAALDAAVG